MGVHSLVRETGSVDLIINTSCLAELTYYSPPRPGACQYRNGLSSVSPAGLLASVENGVGVCEDRGRARVSSTVRFGSDMEVRDAARFAGRRDELRVLEKVLGDDPPATVVLVHGQGGIGKSCLLRETARLARSLGYEVWWLDGRGLAPSPDAVAGVVDDVASSSRPLLLIDTYERISGLGGYLRDHAIPDLPATARVVIAGRNPPGPEWVEGAWDSVTMSLPLTALDTEEATTLLHLRGVQDEETVPELVGWANGEPLALCAGADAVMAGIPFESTGLDDDTSVARTLVSRLAGDELAGADRDVLAVTSIAHAVDARLLEQVLPGVDGEHAEAWLRSLSFAEALGTRVTIHERLRAGLRADLRSGDPGYERELRRRLADHLHDRALAGEHQLVAEISDLIDDPRIRWGLGIESGATHHADIVRPGDEEQAAAAFGSDDTMSWAGLRRWFRESPGHVYTVRNSSGTLVGIGVWVTPNDAPPWASEDTVVGPRLEHARAHSPEGRAVISRGGRPLKWSTKTTKAAIANPAMVGRRGVDHRYFYGARFEGRVQQADFYDAMGYRRVPGLDVVEDGRLVECHILDLGEGGVIGGIRDIVYRNLGLPPPAIPTRQQDVSELVRDALRSYHRPTALAANPLADGATIEQRHESVRRLLRQAIDSAFGDSDNERLLRATIEHGYLDRTGSHESTARRLHLSRATYFRRLSRATDRVATYVAKR